MVGDKLIRWTKLVSAVAQVDLEEAEDQFVWRMNRNSVFSIRSMYKDLMHDSRVPENLISWKHLKLIFLVPEEERSDSHQG